MSDGTPLTSDPEPDVSLTSTDPEPGIAPVGEQPATPQPTLEEVIAERDRLKAAVKGSNKLSEELRLERERRQQMESQFQQLQWQQMQAMQQQQQRPPAQQEPPEPTDEDLAAELNEAMLSADKSRTARVISVMNQRAERRGQAAAQQFFQQATAQNQAQQGFTEYLKSMDVIPGTPTYQRTQVIIRELQGDIRYAWAAGNPAALLPIAIERAKGELGAGKAAATEAYKQQSAAGAGTESSATGNGAPPGKTPSKENRIILNEREKKIARGLYPKMSQVDAEKQYWKTMDANLRDARLQAGRAVS